MKHAMLRTVQVGAALLIVGLLVLALLVIVDAIGRDTALAIGTNLADAITACVIAGLALIGLIGLGRSGDS